MAQPVTVYRWDDPGAPQLVNGKPSEIIDILTKCLVDGYGSKLPLGWTRPFYDGANQAAAFRNNIAEGGSGGYAKFWSVNNTDSNNSVMSCTHAPSMISINELFRAGYTKNFQVQGLSGVNKMDKWALIGSSTAFWFLISKNDSPMSGNSYNPTIFVGDVFCTVPNDPGRFITVASPASGDSALINNFNTMDYIFASTNIDASALKIYDADGGDNFIYYTINYFYNSVNSNSSNANFDGPPVMPAMLSPIFIQATGFNLGASSKKDRLGEYLDNSLISPGIRGVFPGTFINAYAGYRSLEWPSIVNLADNEYWVFRSSSQVALRGFLKLGEWDDPFNPV